MNAELGWDRDRVGTKIGTGVKIVLGSAGRNRGWVLLSTEEKVDPNPHSTICGSFDFAKLYLFIYFQTLN